MIQGWCCPRCLKVNGPAVPQCPCEPLIPPSIPWPWTPHPYPGRRFDWRRGQSVPYSVARSLFSSNSRLIQEVVNCEMASVADD